MKNILKFWGVRGSLPISGKEYERYGGNTSCVSIHSPDDQHILIFDAGSGIVNLGNYILENKITAANLLISHLHMDHILGLPMFAPLHCRNFTLNIYSNYENLDAVFQQTLFSKELFSVQWPDLAAQINLHKIDIGQPLLIHDYRVNTIVLNHPGYATGYRVEVKNHSICYLTDYEHDGSTSDQDLINFMQNSDYAICDGTYSCKDYRIHQGWGHSTPVQAAEFATAAKIKHLILFHHCHLYDDLTIDQNVIAARNVFSSTIAAHDNLVIELP